MEGRDIAVERSGTVEPFDSDADVIVTNLTVLLGVPVGGFFYARIGDGDNEEWISFTGMDEAGGKARLTGVQRALLGTDALDHLNGMPAIYIPYQIAMVDRGAAGTTSEAIPIGATVSPVGFLKNVTRAQGGTASSEHSTDDDIQIFSNVDDAIRASAAHEVAHALTIGPGDEHIANSLMQAGLKRGRYLGGPDPGLYTEFSDDTKDRVDAR